MSSSLFFTPSEVALALPPSSQPAPARHTLFQAAPADSILQTSETALAPAPVTLHVRFQAPNPEATITGRQRLAGNFNYLLGNDPDHWQTNVPSYAEVVYHDLYPGIDLTYNGHEGLLKSTYLVAPGADASRIRWRYDGATDVHIDAATGNVLVTLPGGSKQRLEEHAPVAWQDIAGQQMPVKAHYMLAADGSLAFHVGAYDPHYPLTIDPTLTYSTYLGGSGLEVGQGVTVDDAGNVYIVGSTTSPNFPTLDPVQATYGGGSCTSAIAHIVCTDAFIAKFSPGGEFLYGTYLGGSLQDTGKGIALDAAGNIYVTGDTWSSNFPTFHAVQPTPGGGGFDGFVAKIGPAGNTLVYSTYLGGNSADQPHSIAVAANGSAVVVGSTVSSNFPTIQPVQASLGGGTNDGFVTKLAPDGASFVYSTYLGGAAYDINNSVAVDHDGEAYVTGYTQSNNFPVSNALQDTFGGDSDSFVTKINTDGLSN